MQRHLRNSLDIIWQEAIEKGGILKRHPGVARWQFDRLKPQLRDELTRRLMASTDLIKLNRQQAVAQTLQRFSGWASSVPPGGTDNIDRVGLKQDVRKGIAQLDFVARRLSTDQGAKFLANLSDIIANDAGAIAGRWYSRWRAPGYQYRIDHKERDGKWYLIRDSWAHKAGLVKPIPGNGYVDEHEMPAEFVYCGCRYTYGYALRDLPQEMITQNGKDELARVRAEIEKIRAA